MQLHQCCTPNSTVLIFYTLQYAKHLPLLHILSFNSLFPFVAHQSTTTQQYSCHGDLEFFILFLLQLNFLQQLNFWYCYLLCLSFFITTSTSQVLFSHASPAQLDLSHVQSRTSHCPFSCSVQSAFGASNHSCSKLHNMESHAPMLHLP
jgi:hypothetical protein